MPVAHTGTTSLWRVSDSPHSDFHQKLNGLSLSPNPSLQTFFAFCQTMWPYLLPPLLAIALEAPLSQRTWIAVQKTPAPRRCTDTSPPAVTHLQKLRKHTLTHLAPVYLLFVSLLASYLQCVAYVPPEKTRMLEGLMFGPLFLFATTRLFGLLLRIYSLSVRRDADGDPYVIRTLHPSVPRICAIIPLALGFMITHCFLRHDDKICKVIVHTALLHVFIATDVRSTKSMRAVGVYALTNIVTLLALSVFLVAHAKEIKFLINTSMDATFPGPNPCPGDGSESETGESTAYRWPLFALCVLWNIFPVELVTLCCRFDFWRFYKRSGVAMGTRFEEERGVELDYREGEEGKEGRRNGNVGRKVERGEGPGPSLTHDLLSDAETLGGGKTKGIGPIHLSQNAPDAFYSRVSLSTSPSPSCSSDTVTDPDIESSLLLANTNTPTNPGSESPATPLPSTLRALLPIPFPAFLSSLIAHISTTILLSALFFFTTQGQGQGQGHHELLTSYLLLPLLPLVTLPLTATAVPLGVALFDHADTEDGINDLWQYEESWELGPRSESESELELERGDEEYHHDEFTKDSVEKGASSSFLAL